MTSPANGLSCIELHRVTKRALLLSLPQGSLFAQRNLELHLRASIGRFVSWAEMEQATWGNAVGPEKIRRTLAVYLHRLRKSGWRFKCFARQGQWIISSPGFAKRDE